VDSHQLINSLQQQLPDLGIQLADRLVAAGLDTYAGVPQQVLRSMATAALQGLLTDMERGRIEAFPEYWKSNTAARAEAGARVEDMIQAITIGWELLATAAAELCAGDQALYNWWLVNMAPVIHAGIVTLTQIFTIVRERLIREQEARIRELSTPIMPLYNGILALPLVGAIDGYRAGQVMETLLSGISEQQADVVIIDITGVPVVDTNVANYLLLAARAARLLGAQIILVGISAEVAQTIIQLGSDLSTITTRANLQSGVEAALALQGLSIAAER
jgi:rsbT co-antagonist protein RsbR